MKQQLLPIESLQLDCISLPSPSIFQARTGAAAFPMVRLRLLLPLLLLTLLLLLILLLLPRLPSLAASRPSYCCVAAAAQAKIQMQQLLESPLLFGILPKIPTFPQDENYDSLDAPAATAAAAAA